MLEKYRWVDNLCEESNLYPKVRSCKDRGAEAKKQRWCGLDILFWFL